jgi:hypothetical protein
MIRVQFRTSLVDGLAFDRELLEGPPTVNFSKDRRGVPRPAGGTWASSNAGNIASPATAHLLSNGCISLSDRTKRVEFSGSIVFL